MVYENPTVYKGGFSKEEIEQIARGEWEPAQFEVLSSLVQDSQFFEVYQNTALKLIQLNCYFTLNYSGISNNSFSAELIRINDKKIDGFLGFANKLNGGIPDNTISQVAFNNNPDARLKVFRASETGSKQVCMNTVILKYSDI